MITSDISNNTYSALDLKDAGVTTPLHLDLFMAIVDTEHLGPGWPGVVGRT